MVLIYRREDGDVSRPLELVVLEKAVAREQMPRRIKLKSLGGR
jgi:hypothetical protein